MVNNVRPTLPDSQTNTESTLGQTLKRKFYSFSPLVMLQRKRQKQNPTAHANQSADDEATASGPSNTPNNTKLQSASTPNASANTSDNSSLRKQRSWYGTWPRVYKSEASTKLAPESIMAAKPANSSSPDLSKFEPRRVERSASTGSRPPSMYLGKSKETSGLTMDETMNVDKKADGDKTPVTNDNNVTPASKDNQDRSTETADASVEENSIQRPATSATLLSYIPIVGRLAYAQQAPSPIDQSIPENSGNKLNREDEPSVSSTSCRKNVSNDSDESNSWLWSWYSPSTNTGAVETPASKAPEEPAEEPSEPPQSIESDPNASKGSGSSRQWFSGFYLSSSDSAATQSKESQPLLDSVEKSSKSDDRPSEDTPKFKDGSQPATGSSWAFFSNKKSGGTQSQAESGELAVMGDKSQNKPEPATIPLGKTRKKSTGMAETPSTGDSIQTPEQTWFSQKHLLLPELRETYKLMENPSIIQQLARLVRLSREPPAEHVYLVKEPPKIKKAVVIGVHGLFPSAFLRRILGDPTGTSKKFADHASAAIHRWTKSHGYKCEIRSVQLEYEGRVATRVEQLWKMLLNFIAEIQSADLVMFACHSQGVPVSVMLAAKLLDLGVISSSSTRIGICAMAGVNLGPHFHYKTLTTKTTFSTMTGFELFDLADSESVLSRSYVEALRKVLRFGTRVTYIGSIDDQLVSMESSTFTPAHHPYIYRAVFADGRLHKPDFIVKLVGFALKLRNLGVRDHGLIRELSVALAGPLVTGLGHSVVYDDAKVYDLALQHTLETTSIGDVDLKVQPYNTALKPDPYFLPFAIRGVLDEDLVKTELSEEATELLKQFDDWKPANRELLDVKLRLRALKSML